MVAGDVPDRRRLLLHARLPAGDRRPGRRSALPGRDGRPRGPDPARCAPRLSPRGRGEPPRRGLHRDARAAAVLLEGQAVRPGAAGFRRDGLHHHHDPVRRRRLAHLTQNPALRPWLSGHELAITLVLLALLGGVFLRGFTEAIGIAVALVATYLVLNT